MSNQNLADYGIITKEHFSQGRENIYIKKKGKMILQWKSGFRILYISMLAFVNWQKNVQN